MNYTTQSDRISNDLKKWVQWGLKESALKVRNFIYNKLDVPKKLNESFDIKIKELLKDDEKLILSVNKLKTCKLSELSNNKNQKCFLQIEEEKKLIEANLIRKPKVNQYLYYDLVTENYFRGTSIKH